jgi:uncharacterized protein YukE
MLVNTGGAWTPTVVGGSFPVKTLPVDPGGASQYSAAEIESFFASLEPTAVQQAGAAHTANAATLKDIASAMITNAQKIHENWTGEGAAAALNTMKQMHATATALAEYSTQTGQVLTTLGGVLKEYVNYTVPATLTSAEQDAVKNDQSLLPAVTQAAQARQTAALQAKLTELNSQLAAANAALPNEITVNPPAKSGAGSAGATGSLVVSGGGGSAGGGGTSTGGSGGGPHSGSGGGTPPPVTVPTPRSPIPTPGPPTVGQKPPTVLSGFPGPGPVSGPVPGPGTGPVPPGPAVGTSPGGSPFPTPTVVPSPTTVSGVQTGPGNTGTDPVGTPAEDGIPPVTEAGVDLPGSPFPGTGISGGMVPGEDAFAPGGFSTPGFGNGVGGGLMGDDAALGDSAVMGPDGMIGVPNGAAAGGFDGDGASDGMIADGNPAASGVAGADADGAGGYPMGGAAGGRRDESDRYRQSWMNEDEELWNGGVPMVPSHIDR